MKALGIALACACALHTSTHLAWPQTPLSFYPYAQGNAWQYRDASTQEIVYRKFQDTVWTDTAGCIFIRGRRPPGQNFFEKIDSSHALFNLVFQPDYPRYILGADSGESWVAGFMPPEDTLRVTVTGIYQGYIFGVLTTIKVFTFVLHRPPPWQPFWLGDDHLASGFGLVFSFIEGGSAPYLSGAIISGVHWGEPIVSVKQTPNKPVEFSLRQNYPNPFNPLTSITFELPQAAHVRLSVFDILGRLVSILLDEKREAGHHVVQFDGSGIASGALFYRLEAGMNTQTRRMILLR